MARVHFNPGSPGGDLFAAPAAGPDHAAGVILLIDDNEPSRTALARVLRAAGFRVCEAASGTEGLRLAARQPDLVLLDVNLPDIGGFEVCRRIKGDPATAPIPVLHLSGTYFQGRDKAHGLAGGADGYLTKPVEPEELIAYVQALLRLRRSLETTRAAAVEWQTMFDALGDGVCLVDERGTVARCNRALEELFGLPAGGGGGPAGDARGAAAGGGCPPAELPTVGGRPAAEVSLGGRWFRVTARPVPGRDGAATGAVQLWVDVTPLKVSEEHLAEQARLATAAERRYREIFDNAVEGIFQMTPDGRLLTANPALARMLGFGSPDELLVDAPAVAEQLIDNAADRAAFCRRLHEDGAVRNFETQSRRRDGRTIAVALNVTAVKDPDGRPLRAEGTVEDITERKQAVEAESVRAVQQAAVAEFGRRALATLELRPLLAEACELAARALGVEYAVVWRMTDSPGLRLEATAGVVARTTPPVVVGAGTESPAGLALLENRPVVFEDLAAETRFRTPDWLHEHGVVAGLTVPIIEADEPFGALGAYATARRAFAANDVHFLSGIANVLAAALGRRRVEHALRRTKEEFRIAQAIQRSLFPRESPRAAGFDIAGASHPAQATGGDYFDFIPMADGTLGVVIGDVSGHGFGPALLMAEARAYLRAFAQTNDDVSTTLSLVNRVLAGDITDDRFITLLFGRLDPHTRTLRYASAGHLAGHVLDASGTVKATLDSTGPPLGLFEEGRFPPGPTIRIEPGDTVLLLTDGVIEARGPDNSTFGLSRALDIARIYRADPARRLVDNLYWAVRAFARNHDPLDDVTAIVLKATGATSS